MIPFDPCENPQPRRDQLYAHNQSIKEGDQRRRINGIDEIEVDGQELTLYFLDRAPVALTEHNIRIDGGVRVTGLRVVGINVCDVSDPTIDDCARILIDRVGDASQYTLTLVEARDSQFSLASFDPRAVSISFTFTADCPIELDCAAETPCPPEVYVEPSLDYLAKDYVSFRQLMFDRLALIMPRWTERHLPDIGVTLVELFAYTGDYLSYYQDAVASEAYLDTARRRISVRRHARLIDYRMHEGTNARAWLHIAVEEDMQLDFTPLSNPVAPNSLPLPPISFVTDLSASYGRATVLRAMDIENKAIPRSGYAVFEPMLANPTAFYSDFNEITLYTWGESNCCLPAGTTETWLLIDSNNAGENVDQARRMQRAQASADALMTQGFLLFEEVKGSHTGDSADADPSRRAIVRLTSVTPVFDSVFGLVVLAITWHESDALPFALCLSSTIVQGVECVPLTAISVARGNLLLVDQGETLVDPCTPAVASQPGEPDCVCDDCGESLTDIPQPLRFALAESRLVFSEIIDSSAPASRMLTQDPRNAQPQALLIPLVKNTNGEEMIDPASVWKPQADLLRSGMQDRHFVVEIDDDGIGQIRFGDGVQGMMPRSGMRFCPLYRVDLPESGRIGADAITHMVVRDGFFGGILAVRNPLPASNRIEPEPIAEVKRRAPTAHKFQLMRAIAANDYAQIVMKAFPQIERAAAAFHWTGTWYEVQVAIDPKNQAAADMALLASVEAYLRTYHRMRYDLRVIQARYVPLYLDIDACVKDGYLRGHVEAALRNALSHRRLSDGTLGYFHPDRQTFGTPITLSGLVAAVQSIPGVESVNRLTVTAKDIVYEFPEYRDEVLLPGPRIVLGALEIARMENTPGFAQNGTLTLNLRGGR